VGPEAGYYYYCYHNYYKANARAGFGAVREAADLSAGELMNRSNGLITQRAAKWCVFDNRPITRRSVEGRPSGKGWPVRSQPFAMNSWGLAQAPPGAC
jgi:hypothetical protein